MYNGNKNKTKFTTQKIWSYIIDCLKNLNTFIFYHIIHGHKNGNWQWMTFTFYEVQSHQKIKQKYVMSSMSITSSCPPKTIPY